MEETLFIKSVSSQTVAFTMRNPDGTGINWTFWPGSNHVVMGSTWNQLEGEKIEKPEFMEAFCTAIHLISVPTAAL